MTNQGLLAVTCFAAISYFIILILFFLVDRDRPARFFRFWMAGWVALTLSSGFQIILILKGGDASRLMGVECYVIALALFLAAVWDYTGRTVQPLVFWPALVLGAFFLGIIEHHPAIPYGGVHWFTAILRTALFMTQGLLLWRYSRTKAGYGGKLLAAVMILAGLHSADIVVWRSQPVFLLRVALHDFLNMAIGTAVAVLVLEAARVRMEDLNDKLRRLTLITAASTQSFNVDQMLGVVLHHLVESLNASHGLVRLISNDGEGDKLVIRSAVGFSDTFLMQQEEISKWLPFAKRVLEQEQVHPVLDTEPEIEGQSPIQRDQFSSGLIVRLPGPSTALGYILVGSASKRRFHREEIAFLTNVANFLGLTIQSVRLFEQVANVRQQWANTFDSIDDPIVVHDRDGRIIRVNQAFETRVGHTLQPVIGRTVAEIFRRGACTWKLCPYCEGAGGKGDAVDAVLGGFLLSSNSQFHDPAGQPLGIIHVLQDITDRHRAEEKYRVLIENIQEGIFIATPDNRFLHFNDAFMHMLGYDSREELISVENIGASLYVNPADREMLMQSLREQGSVTNFEFQVRRKDGAIRTVLESSFVSRDSSGIVTAYQGFVLDITERKQAEQEIRRRNRELLVLNTIGQILNQPFELRELLVRALRQVVELFGGDQGAIYLLGADTGLLSLVAAFGMHSDYGRNFPRTPFPSDLLEHICAVRSTILSQHDLPLLPFFREIQRHEGIVASQILVLWSSRQPIGLLSLGHRTPREFASAELNLLTTVGSQVAAAIEKLQLHEETREAYENLRRTQEQLLQSEKMAAVGQLISGVAHELNNPLTAILGYGQLLASTEMVSPQGVAYVEKLYKQAQRSHRIVHNLLSFARQHKPERLPVDLNQILEDTLALREYDLRANNVKVHRQLAKDLPQTSGDSHQLQQVFLNILNNALDAVFEMPTCGELWVRTSREGNRLAVEFVDNGPGVKDVAKIFDPFYTTKPVGKGTGLGLSICYGIVTEHGGEVLVRNAPPRGACFTILLPLLPVVDARKHKISDPALSGARGRILLVEDEEAVRELEREILEGHSCTVTAVRNCHEAIRVIERTSLDMIIVDMTIPGEFTARDFYDWISQHRPELSRRVIFTIGGTGSDEVNALRLQSGCTFLQKPFVVEEFLKAVGDTIGPMGIPAVTH